MQFTNKKINFKKLLSFILIKNSYNFASEITKISLILTKKL